MMPSIQLGALFMVKYYIEVGVKARGLSDLILTRTINILPAVQEGMLF